MLLQRPWCVGYDNVTLVGSFIGGRLGTCGSPISSLSGGLIKAGAFLPCGEGNSASHAGIQAVISQAGAHLPSGEANSSPQSSQVAGRPVTSPSPEEGGRPAAFLASQAGNSPQAGQSGNQGNRSGRQRAPPVFPGEQHCLPGRQCWHLGKQPHNSPPNRLPQGSFPEDPSPKWVINLSSKPLTPAQRSVLAKGPNFVVTPRHPPNLEYITAIEAACTKLSQHMLKNLGLKSIES